MDATANVNHMMLADLDPDIQEIAREEIVLRALETSGPLTKRQMCARGATLDTVYALLERGAIVDIGPNDGATLRYVIASDADKYDYVIAGMGDA